MSVHASRLSRLSNTTAINVHHGLTGNPICIASRVMPERIGGSRTLYKVRVLSQFDQTLGILNSVNFVTSSLFIAIPVLLDLLLAGENLFRVNDAFDNKATCVVNTLGDMIGYLTVVVDDFLITAGGNILYKVIH
jgi:hypothetical protein